MPLRLASVISVPLVAISLLSPQVFGGLIAHVNLQQSPVKFQTKASVTYSLKAQKVHSWPKIIICIYTQLIVKIPMPVYICISFSYPL